LVVLGREAQVGGELLAVGKQALDCRGVAGPVVLGEGVDAGLHKRDQLRAGLEVDVVGVEDLPVGSLHLALGVDWDLRQQVAGSVDQTPLAQRAGEAGLGGVDQAAGTIGDDQQRRAQPAVLEFLQEVAPGVGGLAGARGEPEEHRLALGGDAPGSQHRLRPGAGVHLEAGAVEEQVVQLDLVQTPGRPAVELVLDRLTDPAHGGLAQRSFRAEGVGEGGLHVAHRQAAHNPAITNDANALVLVTPAPKSRDAKRSVVPRSFGRSMVTGPAVVLIVVGQ
jgi:hypothetical protein